MLYQLYESQRAMLNPTSIWAESMSKWFSDPYSVWSHTPMANRVSAGFELLHRVGKEYEKPAFGLNTTTIQDQEVSIAERIELSKPFCNLRNFQRLLPKQLAKHEKDPTVLLVAPLSGHHSTLLRDTVRAMLPDHNVFITDWVDGRMVPLSEGAFSLDDYIAYVIEFVRHLGPDIHVVSVCQPTVPVLAALSIMATLKDKKLPKTMTMMGGPIDPRKSPTEVNNLATTKPFSWFERNVIQTVPKKYKGAGRRVYPGFLQHAGFVAMNPKNHMKSHYDFYLDLLRGDMEDAETHRQFYDEYNAVLDLPAEYYLDTIKTVFQEHRLPLGTWDVKFEGKTIRVAPQDIKTMRLLTIEGELDDISGSGQTEAAQGLCSGIPMKNKRHFTAEKCGHYGIFSGRRWRDVVYPQFKSFIREK